MPSLARFMSTCAVVGLVLYAGMLALANLVEPQEHEIVNTVPVNLKRDSRPDDRRPVRTRTATGLQAEHHTLLGTLEDLRLIR